LSQKVATFLSALEQQLVGKPSLFVLFVYHTLAYHQKLHPEAKALL
jgi:hypothetical protein